MTRGKNRNPAIALAVISLSPDHVLLRSAFGKALGIVNQSPSVYKQQDIWLIRALLEDRRMLPSAV
jgi:hypothetical protein